MNRKTIARLPLEEIIGGTRLLAGLPLFLRRPMNPDRAGLLLQQRLERREADFLDLARQAIYEMPASPYRQLLESAGCELGDLEKLVAAEGIEGALQILYTRGVYLTVDEFKGRQPAVRGSSAIELEPSLLRNPAAGFHMLSQTSGSRGAPIKVPVSLAHIADRLVDLSLVFEARGGTDWLSAVWGVPGGAALINVLLFSGVGHPPDQWFSQIDLARRGLHPRYALSVRMLRFGCLLGGVRIPAPRFVPVWSPLEIAAWMADVLRAGGTPHLYAYTSTGVSLCRAATEAGKELRGAKLTLTGEPITETRMATIHRAGAEATTNYGSNEAGGFIGYGCLDPVAPDEVHLHHDLHAIIQADQDEPNAPLPRDALLISSLRKTAPLILLNVSMGDRANLLRRDCGCGLERIGWSTHLHTIRSFEKLTAGGITFFDTDVIRVLEEVLPKRFGGGPTDYQLVEEETISGNPCLRLLVDPSIGPVEDAVVADAFLDAIGEGSGGPRVAELVWREAGVLQVERREPERTRSGKILHFHVRAGRAQAAPSHHD
jgi:hypothetical protein